VTAIKDDPPFDGNCELCRRLWADYAATTNAHINLIGKQQVAQLRHDHASATVMESQVAAAGRARDAARDALNQHRHSHGAAEETDEVGWGHPGHPGIE
jgi:hypothetical protein